jgi:hypothetical protein
MEVKGERGAPSPITIHESPPAGYFLVTTQARPPLTFLSLAFPLRPTDQTAEIDSSKSCIFVRQDICFNVPESSLWLVLNPVIERLDDIFFEMIGAGVCMHDSLAISLACFDKKSGSHPQCG